MDEAELIARKREIGERIRARRKLLGLSQTELGEAVGVTKSAVSQWENGHTHVDPKTLPILVKALKTTEAYLQTGEVIHPKYIHKTILVGYVGAGQQVIPIDDNPMGQGLDNVESPPDDEQTVVAVQVRGHSMFPVYRDGDLLYYSRDGANDWTALLGKDCVARLGDGRVLVKVLRHGTHKNKWTLASYNSPDIENVDIEWVAPIRWVRRH